MRRSGSAVQLSDESARRNDSKCFLEDGCDLRPINRPVGEWVEHHTEPSREHSAARRGRHEEALGIASAHLLWDIWRGRTPDGHSLVAVVMIVEVAERSVVTREEARHPMAHPFAHPREVQSNRPDASEDVVFHVRKSRAGSRGRVLIDSIYLALTLGSDLGLRR